MSNESMKTDLPTLEAAIKLADQDCPLPSLAGPALKVLRDHVSQLNTKLGDMAGVMALPKDVHDALEHFDGYMDAVLGEYPGGESAWQTIRAHLMSQEAEIDRLQPRLAAANALLQRTQMKDYDAAAWLRLGVEIQAHLSENTHARA